VSLYGVDIDLSNRNTSHTQVVELVGDAQRVLDVGCWTGDLGRILTDRGASVAGVEIDAEAAAEAAKVLERVEVADLNTTPLSKLFDGSTFDAIIFADVLEHVLHPDEVLRDAQKLLAPGGRIVISIPNVTHGSLRLALLQGRWEVTDTGLLDRTHIRFYSRQGLSDLLASSGLRMTELRGTTADPLDVEVAVDPASLPATLVEWVRDQPDALVYQFQVAAVPGAPSALPAMEHGGEPADVRRVDEHTEALRAEQRAALIMRDHVVGLQAEATAAQVATEAVRLRVRRLRERVEKQRNRIESLEAEVARLRGRTMRGMARRAARKLRG
jgi:2-polyprenyl-3-methyl-5-hydroxy-6-metoxy-1,4-benzoquinol methylase